MKKHLLFCISAFFLAANAPAQTTEIELFGLYTWARPQSQIPLKGWGGGGNFLFHVCHLGPEKAVMPWRLQVGVGGYGSGFGKREMAGIPLLPPQSGSAGVLLQNMHAGGTLFTRFSRAGASRIFYWDVFGGARYMESTIVIRPHNPAPGYEAQTNMTYDWTWALNGGIGAGMKQKLTKHIYFDAELLWSYTEKRCNMISMASASGGIDGLTFDPVKSPKHLMLLKAGIHFVIPNDCMMVRVYDGSGYESDSRSDDSSWSTPGDSGSSGSDSGGSAPNSIQINTGTPK